MSITTPNLNDPTLEFLPLFPTETEDNILARLIGWANEGLDPVADADQWVDTREGGHWRTAVMGPIREFARLYDLMGTEVPMSGFVLWAWGTYLDDLAAVFDTDRLPATPATGIETFTGAPGDVIGPGTTISAVPENEDDPAPDFTVVLGGTIPGGGTIDLAIQAVEPGTGGNVAANAITAQSTPLTGITFTNAEPTNDGTDPETDESLRDRVLEAVAGKGPGTVRDYLQRASATPGVGRVQVVPVWSGPNTVLVMVAAADGTPLATALVDSLQADLDPVPGQGAGFAPVGATVTVDTSTLLDIDVVATGMEWEPGYSADGFGGTIATEPGMAAAIAAYLVSIPPGGEAVFARIEGIIATTVGVHDIGAVTVNGAGVNVAVGLTPPKSANLNSLTLS